MYTIKITANGNQIVIRQKDGASIPQDPDNLDYIQFLKDQEAGKPVTEEGPDYVEQRIMEYAPTGDFFDAMSKIHSGVPALAVEGKAQLEDWAKHNVSVKEKYKKNK